MRGLVAVVMMLLVAGCGRPSAEEQQPAAPAGAQRVGVRLSEFKFEPDMVEVTTGKVSFALTNAGAVEHDFVFPDLDKGTQAIRAGAKAELEVELKPGTYTVVCNVPGHKEAGMTMTVVAK